jgi:hypothetical protein
MAHRIHAGLLILAASPVAAWAQVPAGPELHVNTYTTFSQIGPSLASDGAGNFIVAWHQLSPFANLARRFDAAGAPRGGEFRANTYTTGLVILPRVASAADGSFVVAWSGRPGYTTANDVIARRFDAQGSPVGAEFRVNAYTTNHQMVSAVASDGSGRFVVVWSSLGQQDSDWDVYAQRYDAQGSPLGGEFRVNTNTPSTQWYGAAASDAEGNFVVTWFSVQDGSGFGVYAQRYDATGAPRGSEFRVNTYTIDQQAFPSVASDRAGNLVVVWNSYLQDGSHWGAFGQRYDATGTPRGGEFRVNSYTSGVQQYPVVASDAAGNFVVAWSSVHDGSATGVFAQRFDASGAARGAEFRVNTYTTGSQYHPAVVADSSGNFVITWAAFPGNGDFRGIFAQRFGGLQPVALDVDTTGNNVFEPGESVDMRPTWRNVNGLAQAFGGTLTGMGGPAGPVYSIGDGTASYGTVANNGSAQCADCYGVSVSNPPSRPATHWDASATETITPDAHGQQIRWLLHLGDSFTDVSRTNPFYRFVETLLHRGVTGGCGASIYCPSSSTTREQMAVFVLIAKEGAGYVPPACVPPNIFGDVPETSSFCSFIEELSNRGVVSGCGGGNYCPGDAVTREQMAVFVLRTFDSALDPPACTTPVFADVPATSPFCRWIEELARRGVVTGCGGGNYCPTSPVTREQMGVFLGVTFGLTLYGP